MPVLANPRWERFARHLFAGMSTAAAYAAAGYTPNRGNATRLKANEVVRARVRELNVRAAEEVAVTRGWILAALRRNVERAMQAEPVVDREGTPTGAYRYRGAVANRALELLGKEIGMFAARTINEHTGRDGQLFQVLTAAADAIGQLMAQLAAWKNGHAAVVEGEGEPGVAAPANREPGRGTAS